MLPGHDIFVPAYATQPDNHRPTTKMVSGYAAADPIKPSDLSIIGD
jgi:hypothetical protein